MPLIAVGILHTGVAEGPWYVAYFLCVYGGSLGLPGCP